MSENTGQQPERVEEQDVDWLVQQLEQWPTRVHQERTTNIGYLMKEAAKEIHRLLAFTEAGRDGVGDDWQLVPREPTDQMTFVGQTLRYVSANSIGEIYRRMLAAAPTPPDAPE